MKTLALDIGDVMTGTAISDALGMFARPYESVETRNLELFLHKILTLEPVTTVVVGYPKTMRGTVSDQTKKVDEAFADLKEKFSSLEWVLWDERLSSKRADTLRHAKTKDEKKHSHSIAAAFILSTYLDFKAMSR